MLTKITKTVTTTIEIPCFKISSKLFNWIRDRPEVFTATNGMTISCSSGSGNSCVNFVTKDRVHFWMQASEIKQLEVFEFPVMVDFKSKDDPQWLKPEILDVVADALSEANIACNGSPLAAIRLDGKDIRIYLDKKIYDWIVSRDGIYPFGHDFYQINCAAEDEDCCSHKICEGFDIDRSHRGKEYVDQGIEYVNQDSSKRFEKAKEALINVVKMYHDDNSRQFVPSTKDYTLFY